jgi:hypothetical protein
MDIGPGGLDEACWLWTGAISTTGYGVARNGQYAHRAIFQSVIRDLPDEIEVHHLCGTRPCVGHTDIRRSASGRRRCRTCWNNYNARKRYAEKEV